MNCFTLFWGKIIFQFPFLSQFIFFLQIQSQELNPPPPTEDQMVDP